MNLSGRVCQRYDFNFLSNTSQEHVVTGTGTSIRHRLLQFMITLLVCLNVILEIDTNNLAYFIANAILKCMQVPVVVFHNATST